MLSNYIKISLRSLWKNKVYSFLNVFGLGVGIACAGLIFLWVEDELSFDGSHEKKDRLYQLNVNLTFEKTVFTIGSTPRPMAAAIVSEIPGIANAARYSDNVQQMLVGSPTSSLYLNGRYTDASLFSMFTLSFVEGDPHNPFPQLHSVVLSESGAEKLFGRTKNLVGTLVSIDKTKDYVIGGIVKNPPPNATLQFEILAPYEIVLADLRERGAAISDEVEWGSYGPFTFVELQQNANPALVNARLKDFIHGKAPDQKGETFLFPMSDWHLYGEFVNGKQTNGGRIEQVRMLSLVAWIILLIACINFMNLATASSIKRAKEVGVRKVLGSGRQQLVKQFMLEAFLMSALAASVAVLLMHFALPAFNFLMQKRLLLALGNLSHLAWLGAIIFICGLIAGSYPSFFLSSFKPITVLKGGNTSTSDSSAVVRKGLVVAQFAVSVVFIISTIVVYLQVEHVKARELGIDKNNLLEISPQHDVYQVFPIIKEDLMRTGVVENVALADHSTLNGGDLDARFLWQGKSPDNQTAIAHRNVTPEFISTSGMRILKGRDFSSDYSSEKSNVIVNESMAKLMGDGSPIGKVIQSPRDNPDGAFTNMTVIGVVKNYMYGNMYDGTATPAILFCKPPEYQNFIYARLKSGTNVSAALSKIGEVMKREDPAYPFQYRFVDDQFSQMFQQETLVGTVSSVFAILAIMISCLGLFGLAAYTAEHRFKEIGIRKVLGASVVSIVQLLSKDFLRLVVLACVIAFPVAWWMMHNWLQNFEYRIAIGWWIFLVSGIFATLVAVLTISFQSVRAAVVNPIKSLRTE